MGFLKISPKRGLGIALPAGVSARLTFDKVKNVSNGKATLAVALPRGWFADLAESDG